MIQVTRLNGTNMMVNSDLIEIMEETPDTVITLLTGHKFVVLESVDEIRKRVIAFRRACNAGAKTYYRIPISASLADLTQEEG